MIYKQKGGPFSSKINYERRKIMDGNILKPVSLNITTGATPDTVKQAGNNVKTGHSVEAGSSAQAGNIKKGTKPANSYDAVSKNGDTLQLSSTGKKLSAVALAGYPEAKLKQLYNSKEITKQQYDSIIKKNNTESVSA